MNTLPNDDRIVGTTGRLILGRARDQGADDGLQFLSPPPDRNPDDGDGEDYEIPIRGWTCKVDVKTSDVTSSVFYSPKHDLVFSGALPVGVALEARAEGVFRLFTIPQTLIKSLFDGSAFAHVILGHSDVDVFAEGVFNPTNFVITSMIDDAVTYSVALKSYGVVNVNLGEQ